MCGDRKNMCGDCNNMRGEGSTMRGVRKNMCVKGSTMFGDPNNTGKEG